MTAKTPIKPVKSDIDLTTIRIRAVEIATETIVQTVGTAIEEAASEALKSAIENDSSAFFSTMYGKLELVLGIDLGGEDHVSWEVDLTDPLLLVDPEDAEYRANIADALEALAKSIREG